MSLRIGLLVAAGLSAACTDTGSDFGGSSAPTIIAVSPPEFLGDVTCSASPGAMRSFVATVTDVSTQDSLGSDFVLPSSPPTPCSVAAQFRYVVPGHRYSAEVDAYPIGFEPSDLESPTCATARADLAAIEKDAPEAERVYPTCLVIGYCRAASSGLQPRGCGAAADELAKFRCDHVEELAQEDIPPGVFGEKQRLERVQAAFCVPSSGIREMETPDGLPIEPTWRTQCAGSDATSIEHQVVVVGDCEQLETVAGSVAGIAVDPAASLGPLACGDAPDAVATFDVVPQAAGLDAQLGVACGTLPEPFTTGIAAGQSYAFRLDAFAKGSATATWRASCSAVAKEGLVVSAACNALTDQGAIEIALSVDQCPEGASYHVTLTLDGGDGDITFPAFTCGDPIVLAGLTAGEYSVRIDVPNAGGDCIGGCTAVVAPLETAKATCGPLMCP